MDELLKLIARMEKVIEANPVMKARMEELERDGLVEEQACWSAEEEANYRYRHSQ